MASIIQRLALTCTVLLLVGGYLDSVAGQTHGWPVEPTDKEHPIGNSLGEFQIGENGTFQHRGIDILAAPYPDDPQAPWVIATVGGDVVWFDDADGSKYNTTVIVANGIRYTYAHLAFNSYDAAYVDAKTYGTPVAASALIARVHPWGCAYNHLHYELEDRAAQKYINPLIDISPNPDEQPPLISGIHFASAGTRWTSFNDAAPACTIVSGKVNIVANIRDRDAAESTAPGTMNVGVYNVRWRPCPKSSPNCANWQETRSFADMPSKWGNPNNPASVGQFSTTAPWVSDANECAATSNESFVVVTGFSDSGHWNTTSGKFPDGSYSVSVEASDLAGNVTTRIEQVCVHNTPACTIDLAVHDGDGIEAVKDSAAVPYVGSPFSFSPDISVNPGTADEDRKITAGVPNTIKIRVWNVGSCTLPANTSYEVCLGWNSSESIPHPMPPAQSVGCQIENVPAGGWEPGTAKETTLVWTPLAGSTPLGDNYLGVWSNVAADPVQAAPSVVLDNNQALRKIEFVAEPVP